jgi:N-acetylmuramoyl-L-alanine amidase
MRPIHEIIIHATATPANWRAGQPTSAKVAEVRRWHLDRGWSDIGYHYLIDFDGSIATGRPLERVGAHVQGHNTGSVGIALFGGKGGVADGMFEDNYTPAQDKALRGLIGRLKAVYPITQISGHNEYANKACPCFKVMEWYRAPMMPQAARLATVSPFAALLALLAKIFGGK